MHSLKFNLMVVFAVLGLLTGSAHAFGPMMLLMLTGGQHAMGNSHGAGEENRSHASHAKQSHSSTAGAQTYRQQINPNCLKPEAKRSPIRPPERSQ